MMVELIHVRSKNHGVELTPLNICWIEGERAIFARKKVRRGRGGALSSLNRACIAMLHSNRNRLVPSLVEFPPPRRRQPKAEGVSVQVQDGPFCKAYRLLSVVSFK